MVNIAEFTDSELWIVRRTLEERYGRPVEPDQVETEMRLDPHAFDLHPCPALYWEEAGAHFIIVKLGERRYKGQFFYRLHQMYGTGVDVYDDLTECTVSLLQVQADYEIQRQKEATAAS